MVYFNQVDQFSWGGPVYNTELLVLDSAVILMLTAVLAHALFYTKTDGLVLIATTLCVGVIVELGSVYLTASHCHAESLVMLGPCCSVSAVLYYAGWMYSCYAIGNRVPLQSTFARNLLVASLHPLFSIVYEVTAVNSGWLIWGGSAVSDGVGVSGGSISDRVGSGSGHMHDYINGGPSVSHNLQGTFSALLGGVTGHSDTAFLKLQQRAMTERLFGVPVIVIMFQFFLGVAFHWCRVLAKLIVEPSSDTSSNSSSSNNSCSDCGTDTDGGGSSSIDGKQRSFFVIMTDSLTEVFVVATLAPLVALLPLAVLVKCVVGGRDSLFATNWAGGYFSFMSPFLFNNKYPEEIWLLVVSSSILVASITAVFADPIFRKVNRHNIYSFSSNAQLVADAVPRRQGVSVLVQLYDIYLSLLGRDRDRDLILLCIPYTLLALLVCVIFRQMFVEFTYAIAGASSVSSSIGSFSSASSVVGAAVFVLVPWRVAALALANMAFWIFGYFNFSELEWRVVQKHRPNNSNSTSFSSSSSNRNSNSNSSGSTMQAEEWVASRQSIFSSISPNRVHKHKHKHSQAQAQAQLGSHSHADANAYADRYGELQSNSTSASGGSGGMRAEDVGNTTTTGGASRRWSAVGRADVTVTTAADADADAADADADADETFELLGDPLPLVQAHSGVSARTVDTLDTVDTADTVDSTGTVSTLNSSESSEGMS